MDPVETFKVAGLEVTLGLEEDPGFGDPREWDNITELVCWHPDYALGDYQVSSPDGRGYVVKPFEIPRAPRDLETLRRYILATRAPVGGIVCPLFLLDHSGLSLTMGAPSIADPSPHWDTTAVGFVYCPAERVLACCGDGDLYRTVDFALESCREDTAAVNAYLQGSVYWYSVRDARGEVIDSCGGFLIVDHARDWDYLKSEATASAEYHASAYERAKLVWRASGARFPAGA